MEHTDYDKQADDFLYMHSMEIRKAFKGDRCPPWESGDCMHGDQYRVTVKRFADCHPVGCERRLVRDPRSISFDFWNSFKDVEDGNGLSDYSVLAAVSADVTSSTDPDEVHAEFGDMKPSQARAIAKFAERLQAFFTDTEQEHLADIQ